ncbi:MAG: isochorismatase family protein [Candidatus Omnitrophica bacterium]|nr:isochorismatase family protein [Candidatus Omnitrophota bacterium]
MSKAALLIVDAQNDFCPGGKLPVKDCDKIISNINISIDKFKKVNLPIIASRDWHPADSRHFKEFGGDWPTHCVRNSKGAEFHPLLNLPDNVIVISKGTRIDEDSYSAFEGQDDKGLSLSEVIKKLRVKKLFICGLATDYCVKSSALDALKAGLEVYLLLDCVEAVDINKGDGEKAIEEMAARGVKKIETREVVF